MNVDRMRRHAEKLRVDGLRPDGTFDDLVLVSTLRAFRFLPGDIGVARRRQHDQEAP